MFLHTCSDSIQFYNHTESFYKSMDTKLRTFQRPFKKEILNQTWHFRRRVGSSLNLITFIVWVWVWWYQIYANNKHCWREQIKTFWPTKELVNCVSENFSSWGNPTITVCREIIFLQVQKTRIKHFMAWVDFDFTYWLCRNPPSKHYPLYALYFRFSGISLIVIQVKSSMLPFLSSIEQNKLNAQYS